MKKKIPSRFRKSLKEKQFKRKILSKIHLPKEQEFISSLFKEDESGILVPEIEKMQDKQYLEHLKKLDKAIRKNRGILVGWKLAIIALPAAAFFLFNLLFLDSLAEKELEQALETVFQGKADIQGLDIALFDGKVSFQHLTIGDKEEALRNSIEMEYTEIALNSPALLRKRVVIEKMESRRIRFGTVRESSGLLDKKSGPKRASGAASENETGAGAAAIAGEAAEAFASMIPDPEDILKQYSDELKTPDLLQSVNEEISAIPSRWEERIKSYDQKWQTLHTRAETFLAIDPRQFRRPEEITQYIEEADGIRKETQSFRTEVDSDIADLKTDLAKGSSYKELIKGAIDEDLAFIQTIPGSISDLSGDIVSGSAKKVIREKLGPLSGIVEKGFSYLKETSRGEKRQGAERDEEDRRGMIVPYPRAEYPPFLLRSLIAEFGLPGESGYTYFSVDNLVIGGTGWEEPLSIAYIGQADPLAIEARIGVSQTGRPEDSEATLLSSLSGIPLKIEKPGIPGIESLSGTGSVLFEGVITPSLTGGVTGAVSITETDYRYTGEEDLLSRAVRSVFSDLAVIEMETNITLQGGEISSIAIATDLDKRIGSALQRFGKEEAERLAAEFTETFLASLSIDRQEFEAILSEIEAVEAELTDDKARAQLLERQLASAKAEGQKQIETLANEAAGQLQERATEEGKKAIESLGKSFGF